MAATAKFYRTLGLALLDAVESENHVECAGPGGLRVLFDTVAVIHSHDPGWVPPSGGHRIALAFTCQDPADVDTTFQAAVAAGGRPHVEPWDALGGQYSRIVDILV